MKLSAANVARLLIAYSAVEMLSEVDGRMIELCNAKPTSDEGRCPLTGQATFAAALTALLERRELANLIHYVEIEMNGPDMAIVFRDFPKGKRQQKSLFHHGSEPAGSVRGVRKTASIYPKVIWDIGDLLKAEQAKELP